MRVLDASAVVEWLVRGPQVAAVEQRLSGPLSAPELMAVEVVHVLRRLTAVGALTADRARVALKDLDDLGVSAHGHRLLLPRVWALRDVATAYDAAYLALAEALEAPLVTLDARLARATGHQAVVDLLG